MNPDFKRAHAFTSLWEGGYVWHKDDPGGETSLGVTKTVWLAWCKSRGLPVKPMRNLTMADVLPLYEERYWNPLAASLPWPLSAAIYDMSVNHGLGDKNPSDENGNEEGATFLLWRARQLQPKGSPLLQALAACDAREEFYRAIVRKRPARGVFMTGWMRRVNAQRVWLRENAEPLSAGPRVFLTDTGGTRALWDGETTVYGGATLSKAWVSQMQLVYPKSGTYTVGGIKLTVATDGALILNRA